MKIYMIPVSREFQPETSQLIYPKHSSYIGVERVFYEWILKDHSGEIELTDSAEEADYCYLPIFWTNYFLNHHFAKSGMKELEAECARAVTAPEKTFTLCQYDDGPVVDLGETVLFLASRRTKNDRDIPLLCSPHQYTPNAKKKYIAGFVGRAVTHPIRRELKNELKGQKGFRFLNGKWGEKIFVHVMERSYACLCPRGYGGSSFRFFEAMQMGVVPVHIGDIDIRPFKGQIAWEECSFYFEEPGEAVRVLRECPIEQLQRMGRSAKELYEKIFGSDQWCGYVIRELGEVKNK